MKKEPVRPVESTFPSETPALASPRPTQLPNHRPGCQCNPCKAVAAKVARGEPTYIEEVAAAAVRNQARIAERKRRGRRSREKETRAAVAASVEAQLTTTGKINPGLIAKSVAATSAGRVSAGELRESVLSALENAGITDDRLAQVASEGLDAFLTRILTDKNGNVVEAIKVKDFHAIHKFLQTVLSVKGYLGREDAPQPAGGLFIILEHEVSRARPNHPATCVCVDCVAALEEWKASTKNLRLAEARRHAIDAEILSAIDGAPGPQSEVAVPPSTDPQLAIPDEDDEDIYQVDPNEPKY